MDTDKLYTGYVHSRTKRVAVPVSVFTHSELNGDEYCYLYIPEAENMGMECWYRIEGIDFSTTGDNKYYIDGVANWTKTVDGDYLVFVTGANYQKLQSIQHDEH